MLQGFIEVLIKETYRKFFKAKVDNFENTHQAGMRLTNIIALVSLMIIGLAGVVVLIIKGDNY